MSAAYRPEIDGLRAIAVLSVVLYHFGVPGIPGGFVGVDIFFVISGSLIGGILWSDLRETGRIRLARFYLRRLRRLAPAYFAMAAATLVMGWLILLPFEFREFGKSLIAATVYLSTSISTAKRAISTACPKKSRCCTHGRWRLRNSSTSSCHSFSWLWSAGGPRCP